MASHMKPASSSKTTVQPKVETPAASDTAESPALADAPEPRRGRRWLWAIPAGALVLLAGAYVGGALYFQSTFLPGTTLDGQDVSLRPVSEVAAEKSASLDGFEAHVTGSGLDLTVTAEQAGLACDGDSYVQDALAQASPWAWPAEIAGTRELSATAEVTVESAAGVPIEVSVTVTTDGTVCPRASSLAPAGQFTLSNLNTKQARARAIALAEAELY